MAITYDQRRPEIDDIIAIYQSSGIKRPVQDADRIREMYRHANLVITCMGRRKARRHCPRADRFQLLLLPVRFLAVRAEYQHQGIGKRLIGEVKQAVGEQSMLLLLSAPAAMDYYPKIGMETVSNGFMIKRTE